MKTAQIRWLAPKDLSLVMRWAQEAGWLMDQSELEQIQRRFFYLCLGAYEGPFLIGAITGYLHEKSAWLGNFIVDPARRKEGIGARLFDQAIETIEAERPSVWLHAAASMVPFYESRGFKSVGRVGRYELRHKPANFSLNAAQVRELERSEPSLLLKLDRAAFSEDRTTLLMGDLKSKSALLLESDLAALYTRILSGKVFLGPWLVRTAAYMDAERLLRAAIYQRGLKPLCVDVPIDNSDAVRLLKQYGFEPIGQTHRMVRGESPQLHIENIYGFATSGSHG